jgi:hypothetical protein
MQAFFMGEQLLKQVLIPYNIFPGTCLFVWHDIPLSVPLI